jgi:SAM-dependent methyltransferase
LKVCLSCGTRFEANGWRCPSCGHEPEQRGTHFYFAPELAEASTGYDSACFGQIAQLEAGNFWFRARNRLIVWALQRYFRGARNLLEIGCGTGYVLSGIASAAPGLRLSGSEVDRVGLEYAASRVPRAHLMQMDARRLPFAAEFDVIGAFDVLEHIDDDAAVLREMFSALVPGGGILVTVPQHPALWSEYDVRAHHVRRYRKDELRDKVTAAGFHVARTSSFVSLLLPLLFGSRLRQKAGTADYDPLAELRLPRWLNAALETVLDVERWLIRGGVSLPAGGSLLLVACKPQ